MMVYILSYHKKKEGRKEGRKEKSHRVLFNLTALLVLSSLSIELLLERARGPAM